MLAIIIGLTIGVGLPMQTSVNSRLRQSLGSPFWASFISFLIGTVFLAVMTLFEQHTLLPALGIVTTQPAWLWLGGLFGVVYLTGNIVLFPKIGSVQTVIMPVLGQILAGLLIDNFGWFHSPVSALTLIRWLGALLVLIGVVITVAGNDWLARKTDQQGYENVIDAPTKGNHLMFWRMFGVFAGMLSASQTAINGHLGMVLNSKVQAAFISFLVGTVALGVIVLGLRLKWQYQRVDDGHNPWWMWLGGFIGSFYVLGNIYLVPLVGTGLAVIIVLVGLMAGSLLIDQFGWLASKRNPVTPIQIIGLLVMIVGVGVVRLL